tara:strand:+ start:272 stop:655 length:384 start_codon:yes stop_codon:yes gene_type:complete
MISASGNGSLSFGYRGDMNIMDLMEHIDTLKTYVKFLEIHDVIDIDDTFMADQSFEIDLDDTQSFFLRSDDYKLCMCVMGIAYDTRCRAYFAQNIEGDVVLLEVQDDSTDRIYYERQEAGCVTGDTT